MPLRRAKASPLTPNPTTPTPTDPNLSWIQRRPSAPEVAVSAHASVAKLCLVNVAAIHPELRPPIVFATIRPLISPVSA